MTDQVAEDQVNTTSEQKLDFAQVVQKQVIELKDELLKRFESLKAQFPLSQADLFELKDVLTIQASHILEDVTKVSKDIKQDISEISLKHKGQITETFKASKDNVIDAFNKINLSQPKEKPEA